MSCTDETFPSFQYNQLKDNLTSIQIINIYSRDNLDFSEIFFNRSIYLNSIEVIPIWEAPYPFIYAVREHPDWKRRYGIKKATEELSICEIDYRFSFHDTMEPDGLFFGHDDELPDGSCKMCNKELIGSGEESGLFCSEHCETAFGQLKELRSEEGYHNVKCILCGKPLGRWDVDAIEHHIQYEPEEKMVYVCRSCHMKIHSNYEKFPDLAPKRPPDWKIGHGT